MCQGLEGQLPPHQGAPSTQLAPKRLQDRVLHIDVDGSAELASASQLDLGQAALEGKGEGSPAPASMRGPATTSLFPD
eukprot:511190-Alexandrium_andersonii.AAC.1